MKLVVDIKKRIGDFTLEVAFETDGETTGLLGASGSGKSITLQLIAGIETPDEGQIVLNNRVLFDSEKGINLPSRKRRVSYLFQNYALFPHMTVAENILFPLTNVKEEKRKDRLEEVLRLMALKGLKNRYPAQLSGGQQQRVALARGIIGKPEALLLDEPFSALDDYLKTTLIKELMEALKGYQGATLFVSHNMEEAYRICPKLLVLSKGRVEAYGSRETLHHYPPTLSVAKLTGYRSFSKFQTLSSYVIKALEWDIELQVENIPAKQETFITIASEKIYLAEDSPENANIFSAWINTYEEGPRRVLCYLTLKRPPAHSKDDHLEWELSKEEWENIKNKPQPFRIRIPKEGIRFLKE
ncbi:sulfate/molybdate ABC transporter ATP-binding protein [Isachenkonia alkalipeptolytica]|uniref:ATP-binding cassette domain-containing protein n=1 Tax=Isachenkonia alkalipeptolytica TaxID=2565777 RepID=A0AA44BET2_9CLOT|nr:ATP-binding cassette domain-containing protein [Isachenkonia alkalipeptolytica]NBG89277.1 ATP-binding cassette domain-containing protein [Isachenkonia alkalipeptolytica]